MRTAINEKNLTEGLQKLAVTGWAIKKICKIAEMEKEQGAKHLIFHRLQDDGLLDHQHFSASSEADIERICKKEKLNESFKQVVIISL